MTVAATKSRFADLSAFSIDLLNKPHLKLELGTVDNVVCLPWKDYCVAKHSDDPTEAYLQIEATVPAAH